MEGRTMDHKKLMITEYVKLNEDVSSDAMNYYRKSVDAMRKKDLARVNKSDVEEIVKPYLYKWGRMQRALNREKFHDIVEQIQLNHETLEKFRKKNLLRTDIGKCKSDIEDCYDSFEEVIGKTAAPKVLHLVCPDFFPLWDNNIRKAYRKESNNTHEPFSGADYYEFMLRVKTFIKEYEDVLIERDGRTTLKVLDDFFWALANRPFIIFKGIFPKKS